MLRPIFLQCRIGDLVALEIPHTKVALELSGIYVTIIKYGVFWIFSRLVQPTAQYYNLFAKFPFKYYPPNSVSFR
jgi:hypothetical protein